MLPKMAAPITLAKLAATIPWTAPEISETTEVERVASIDPK